MGYDKDSFVAGKRQLTVASLGYDMGLGSVCFDFCRIEALHC